MRPTVPAGMRGTISGDIASHRSKGKRKAIELDSSGDTTEPATRRPAPGAASAPLPASSSRATGEQAASGGRNLVSPKAGRPTTL
jgi:hypothetical protein